MRGFARLLDEPRSAIKVQVANGQANLSRLGRRQEFVNAIQVKCLLVLMAFVVIGFGPLSPTCLLGLYVVIARPRWFFELVQALYRRPGEEVIPFSPPAQCAAANAARFKAALVLLTLLVLDIAPIPVASPIGIYVVIARPKRFKAWVERIYLGDQRNPL